MALPESLETSIKSNVLGENTSSEKIEPVKKEKTGSGINALFNIIAKNTMSFPDIARDLNVARQNAQQLVKIMGGDSKTKAEALTFKSESEQRKKTEVQVGEEQQRIEEKEKPVEESKEATQFNKAIQSMSSDEEQKDTSATPISEESKEERASALGFFQKEDEKEQQLESQRPSKVTQDAKKATDDLKKSESFFSMSNIMGLAVAAFQLGSLLYVFYEPIKEAVVLLASEMWESIKKKFGEFVESIKEWFNEVVQPIIDKVKDFVMPIIEKIGAFFKSIGDWFVDKFGFIGEWFTNAFGFVGKIVDKFKVMIEGVKEALRNAYENIPEGLSFLKKYIPDSIVKFIGAKTEKEKEEEKKKEELQKKALANVVDDSREAKKLQQQQGEAQKAEAERADIPRRQEERQKKVDERDRVAALEKEKQYTGTDEIVRARLGLPEKAAAEMEVGPEVTQARTPLAPTKTPAPAPQKAPSAAPSAPSPAAKGGKEEPVKTQGGTPGLIVEALKEAGINSPKAHANVLATVKAESNFKVQSENLNYSSADRIKSIFGPRRIPSTEFAQQFVKNPEALANHVYKTTDGNSEPGDGFKYRGRGFIQHTGKNQYAAISKATGVDLLSNPDALNSPEVAAKAIPWFFLGYKRMKPEDMDNMGKVNKAVGFAGGAEYAAKREESAKQIYAQMQSSPGTEVASASNDVAISHREQVKPQTPVIVNAPVTNNTTIQNNQVASASKPSNGVQTLTARTV